MITFTHDSPSASQSLRVLNNEVAIAFTDVRKVYGQGEHRIAALDGVSLNVKSGEIYGVLGQSGAGKSTLIRCVNQLEKPTSGSVQVHGQEMTRLAGAELRQARQQIGMIFQHFNLLSSRTVAQNVAFPLEIIGYSKLQRRARVEELLVLVGLEGKANAYPAQLSGGQKQRVGIARALAGEPKVLLSDEATSALDPQTTRSILDLLRDLNRRIGVTILLITHEMSVVKHICDSVAVLQAGRIVEQGQVSDLIAQPRSLLSQEFFPRRLNRAPRPGASVATIAFNEDLADEPIFSTLTRNFDVTVNILSGSVEPVGDRRVGQFQIELTGDKVAEALKYLHELKFAVEVQ
ncbi:ATP-binding cassette domain-containing protein [Phormidium tenue FACHB-886]|nr:ATP-binding cassette domain-containing protein [Phormidium tenue FACHB-886]